MKLKENIEKGIYLAGRNVRAAEKRAENDIDGHDEMLYWSGVQEALQWVLEKKETGLDDFVSYK